MKGLLQIAIFAALFVFTFSQSFESELCSNNDIQCLMNNQITRELQAFYFYESMAVYYERPSVGLMGFHKFFRECADEELDHARQMMKFVNKRGEKVSIASITLPSSDIPGEWTSPAASLEAAIRKEEDIYKKIVSLHETAGHPSVHAFLDDFIAEQIDSIAKLSSMKSRLGKSNNAILVQMMNEELLNEKKK